MILSREDVVWLKEIFSADATATAHRNMSNMRLDWLCARARYAEKELYLTDISSTGGYKPYKLIRLVILDK